ncbi:MAG: hypothetical protein WCV79_04165 [Candidatus Paceibacterota bacterium]
MDFVQFIIPMAHAAVDTAAFAKVMDPIVREIIYPIVYVIFALGVFVFGYGVIEMIIKGSAEARETGRRHILFGAIGMFIMISAWGIVHFVSDTLFDIRKGATNSEIDNTIDPAGEIMK